MSEIIMLSYGIFRKSDDGYHQPGKHLGTLQLGGFKMYSAGGFPYAIPDCEDYEFPYRPIVHDETSNSSITVDKWKMSKAQLRSMDQVEGVPFHYTREIVYGHGFIYIPNRNRWGQVRRLPRVESGDFLKYKQAYATATGDYYEQYY